MRSKILSVLAAALIPTLSACQFEMDGGSTISLQDAANRINKSIIAKHGSCGLTTSRICFVAHTSNSDRRQVRASDVDGCIHLVSAFPCSREPSFNVALAVIASACDLDKVGFLLNTADQPFQGNVSILAATDSGLYPSCLP